MTTLLDVTSLTLRFNGVTALDGVTLHVEHGELLGLIGPNGAGKTSLFNCVTGTYRPSGGHITFNGHDITAAKPHRIARHGLIRTFQQVENFPTMTVLDNLLLGRHNHSRIGVIAGAIWEGFAVRDEIRQRAYVETIIDFLDIQDLRHQTVRSLPYGLQKRVELGRALAMEPQLLLLDEPVAGMNQEETEDMVRAILDVKDELGITVVLVEHDMSVVMQVSDRVCVLDSGRVIAAGDPATVADLAAVRDAYLGTQPDPTPSPGNAHQPAGRTTVRAVTPPPAQDTSDLQREARQLHTAAAQLRTGKPNDNDIDAVIDLMLADVPLADVLAACSRLIPETHGTAAIVAKLHDTIIISASNQNPANQLSKDERWWRDTITDGRCRAPATFHGYPAEPTKQAQTAGFGTAWMLPLYDTDTDDTIGCLAIWTTAPHARDAANDHWIRRPRELAALLIREERRRQHLHREATTDPLTRLANRTALHNRLRDTDKPITAIVIDLDDFKPINDTHGHDIGDIVLQIVGRRIRRGVRDEDLVVRLGGDEYAVILAHQHPDGATALAQRLINAIQAPINIDGLANQLRVRASAGTATSTADDVLKAADEDLYRHKPSSRRNRLG